MDSVIGAYTLTSAAGRGLDALRQSLRERAGGLRRNDFPHSTIPTWIGRVDAADGFEWDDDWRHWQSRNNALAWIGLQQDGFTNAVEATRERFGPTRVGVIIGTSTSNIGRTEAAYRQMNGAATMPADFRQPAVHQPGGPSAFVAAVTELTGPQMTISTACASSAKVFASAERWLAAGIVDAVLVGGVDSLCLSVLHGFASLELTSAQPCRPFDRDRDGISIGEAAGFALVTRAADGPADGIRVTGYGESSDAHHMSHPHPEGAGALASMTAALQRAGRAPADIDYVNLHGTASRANDAVEAMALAQLFPDTLTASSTKAWTGHALGAAGIVECVIAFDALNTGLLPGTLNLQHDDETLAFPIARDNRELTPRAVLSNSFGFGGNNCSLVFEGPA